MAVITAHQAGLFCWTELSTTDAKAAKAFYGELFGWGANDLPMGPDAVYSMMQIDGHDAAALFQQGAEDKAREQPPHWRSYICVANADEATRRITDAGGQVLAGPMDVFDAGRMSVAQDPTGAVFAVWQPRAHIGAGWVKDPGGVAWNELITTDTATAAQFYARAFGWAAEAQPGPTPYTVFKSAGREVGGMMTLGDETAPMPPHWNVYFAVPDCDAAVERAKGLGGRVLAPPMEIPNIGRFAVLADPQGAAFSIIKTAAAAQQ